MIDKNSHVKIGLHPSDTEYKTIINMIPCQLNFMQRILQTIIQGNLCTLK